MEKPCGYFRKLFEAERYVFDEGEIKRLSDIMKNRAIPTEANGAYKTPPPPTKREIHGSVAIGTSYLHDVLHPDNLAKTARKMVAMMRERTELDYDSIAFRGLSGTLIAPILALRLKKRLLCVRKPKTEEGAHGYFNVEGYSQYGGSYVIVDDLIDTGGTVCAIYEQIKAINLQATGRYIPYKPVAIFLYRTQNAEDEYTFNDDVTVPVYYLSFLTNE